MDLYDWLACQPRGTQARIVRDTGVSQSTVSRLLRGERTRSAALAKAISDATGGVVAIDELLYAAQADDE